MFGGVCQALIVDMQANGTGDSGTREALFLVVLSHVVARFGGEDMPGPIAARISSGRLCFAYKRGSCWPIIQ